MTKYFEETLGSLNKRIDFALFKRIAFGSGVPLILVDLFSYLTGQTEKVVKAMYLLKERVEPKRIHRKQAFEKEMGDDFMFSMLHKFSKKLELKLFNEIPPLKDFPEEIESDDSDLSESMSN